jgi:hypothetical protein
MLDLVAYAPVDPAGGTVGVVDAEPPESERRDRDHPEIRDGIVELYWPYGLSRGTKILSEDHGGRNLRFFAGPVVRTDVGRM